RLLHAPQQRRHVRAVEVMHVGRQREEVALTLQQHPAPCARRRAGTQRPVPVDVPAHAHTPVLVFVHAPVLGRAPVLARARAPVLHPVPVPVLVLVLVLVLERVLVLILVPAPVSPVIAPPRPRSCGNAAARPPRRGAARHLHRGRRRLPTARRARSLWLPTPPSAPRPAAA